MVKQSSSISHFTTLLHPGTLPLLLLASLCYPTSHAHMHPTQPRCNFSMFLSIKRRLDEMRWRYCFGKWAIVFPVIEQETFCTAQDIMCQNVTASKAQRKIFPTSLSSISLLGFIYSVLFFFPTVQIWCLIFSSVVPLNSSATHLSCSRQMINWSVISYEALDACMGENSTVSICFPPGPILILVHSTLPLTF